MSKQSNARRRQERAVRRPRPLSPSMERVGLGDVVVAALAGDEQALADWARHLEEMDPDEPDPWPGEEYPEQFYLDWLEWRRLGHEIAGRQVGVA